MPSMHGESEAIAQGAAVAKLLDRFAGRFPEGWDPEDTCSRFLSAREGDVEAAASMLEESLAWRATFVEGGVSSLLDFQLEEEDAVRQGFPQCFHKVDRLGRPVQYFCVGDSDPNKLIASTTLDRLLRWNVHRAEHTIRVKYPRCSAAASKHVSSSVCIVDLEGANLSHFTADVRDYMQRYFKLLGDNFPGNLGRVFIINCPLIFTGIWAVVRLFLPPADRERIQLFGGAWTYESALLADIDPANLPTRYGGTDTTFTPYRDNGPWDSLPTGESEMHSPPTAACEVEGAATAKVVEATETLKGNHPPMPPPVAPIEVL